MDRREFLVRMGGVLVAVPFVLEAVSCGDDKGPTQPANSFSGTGTGSGHTHSLTVLCVDLSRNSVTYTSGTGGSPLHSHPVTLDMTNLQDLTNEQQVQINTSDSHAHTWTIQKPRGACA
jgi:hypothetical protein